MLIVHLILAAIALGAITARPRSRGATAVCAVAAAVDLALGASIGPALGVVARLVAFLGAALTLASFVERSGLAARLAHMLAATARGNALSLYALVCLVCLGLTMAVSLDVAVVLIVPVLVVLARRFDAPFAPLFLGAVAVANAGSVAVPQGNPTNLVVITRLNISPLAFTAHMLLPGLVAAAICAVGIALGDRAALAAGVRTPCATLAPITASEWHATAALLAAALATFGSLALGVAPWWPFSATVLVALASARQGARLVVPWRAITQVAGLLVVIGALAIRVPGHAALGLPGLLACAVGVGVAAALANNLPVSVLAAGLLATPSAAYAASIGLAVGALALPQGSVATMIAADLGGSRTPRWAFWRLAPLAAAATLAATLVLGVSR